MDGFAQKMHELGYTEGKNLTIEWRYANGDYELLPSLAAELVEIKADVIVTNNLPGTQAAQRATSTIPIVFSGIADPVSNGVVKSLSRPEGNVTGLSLMMIDIIPKQVELLASIVPKLSRIAYLQNPQVPIYKAVLRSVQASAQQIGATVLSVEAKNTEEIERGFIKMADWGAQGLMVWTDPYVYGQRSQIAQLASRNRVPSMCFFVEEAEAGYLCSYGQDRVENYRHTAVFVDKILKGAKPSDLPVEQPTIFPFVINLKTAKALGIKIPPAVLLRADRVIE